MPKVATTKLKDNQGTKWRYSQYLQQRVNILHFRQTIQAKYKSRWEYVINRIYQ